MYKIEFKTGQAKYFHTYGEALEYCRFFDMSAKRIKPVH